MDLPPVPRELTPEERQAVAWVRENGDRFQTFSLSLFDLDDDDKASLALGTTEELAN